MSPCQHAYSPAALASLSSFLRICSTTGPFSSLWGDEVPSESLRPSLRLSQRGPVEVEHQVASQ